MSKRPIGSPQNQNKRSGRRAAVAVVIGAIVVSGIAAWKHFEAMTVARDSLSMILETSTKLSQRSLATLVLGPALIAPCALLGWRMRLARPQRGALGSDGKIDAKIWHSSLWALVLVAVIVGGVTLGTYALETALESRTYKAKYSAALAAANRVNAKVIGTIVDDVPRNDPHVEAEAKDALSLIEDTLRRYSNQLPHDSIGRLLIAKGTMEWVLLRESALSDTLSQLESFPEWADKREQLRQLYDILVKATATHKHAFLGPDERATVIRAHGLIDGVQHCEAFEVVAPMRDIFTQCAESAVVTDNTQWAAEGLAVLAIAGNGCASQSAEMTESAAKAGASLCDRLVREPLSKAVRLRVLRTRVQCYRELATVKAREADWCGSVHHTREACATGRIIVLVEGLREFAKHLVEDLDRLVSSAQVAADPALLRDAVVVRRDILSELIAHGHSEYQELLRDVSDTGSSIK